MDFIDRVREIIHNWEKQNLEKLFLEFLGKKTPEKTKELINYRLNFIEPLSFKIEDCLSYLDKTNKNVLVFRAILNQENRSEHRTLIEIAKNKGSLDALVKIGDYYMDDRYIKPNYNKAFKYYNEAGEKGLGFGFTCIGILYMNQKLDDAKDEERYEKAIEYYYKAIELNCPQAMLNMAQMFIKGKGIEKDLKKGYSLLLKSCSMGYKSTFEYIISIEDIISSEIPDFKIDLYKNGLIKIINDPLINNYELYKIYKSIDEEPIFENQIIKIGKEMMKIKGVKERLLKNNANDKEKNPIIDAILNNQ